MVAFRVGLATCRKPNRRLGKVCTLFELQQEEVRLAKSWWEKEASDRVSSNGRSQLLFALAKQGELSSS